MSTPTRPLVRYHGGKWRLAPWVIAHLPAHRAYVEPFGGAASVLLRKQRCEAEVYNDLDGRMVSLFEVLRDPLQSAELVRLLELTPYARVEHERSYDECEDPVERARRTIVRGMFGHGSRGTTSSHRTGFRTAKRRGFLPASDWVNYLPALKANVERLRGVVIECRDFSALIPAYDGVDTVFYVDPPYPQVTRTTLITGRNRAYAHEMSDEDHHRLAAVLRAATGMVVLSGYPCDLYDRVLYPDWRRVTRAAMADGRIARTEVLWLNPACCAALDAMPAAGAA